MVTGGDFSHTWYVMPLKPRFLHPVRQVRTCLGLSQPAFAKLAGCSAIAIQRIENGSLPLSQKLACTIMEATGADPVSLLAGNDATALDMMAQPYSKLAHQLYKTVLPCDERESQTLLLKIFQQLQLLFVVSNRGGKHKTYAVNDALQSALVKLAEDFNLTKSIGDFLIAENHVTKKRYRVCDLRKFTEYARILGYKDNKRFKPDKVIEFKVPRGWLVEYVVYEKAILPHGADRKLRDTRYIMDDERPVPPEVQEAIDQHLYWEIVEFRSNFASKPVR